MGVEADEIGAQVGVVFGDGSEAGHGETIGAAIEQSVDGVLSVGGDGGFGWDLFQVCHEFGIAPCGAEIALSGVVEIVCVAPSAVGVQQDGEGEEQRDELPVVRESRRDDERGGEKNDEWGHERHPDARIQRDGGVEKGQGDEDEGDVGNDEDHGEIERRGSDSGAAGDEGNGEDGESKGDSGPFGDGVFVRGEPVGEGAGSRDELDPGRRMEGEGAAAVGAGGGLVVVERPGLHRDDDDENE